jgi:dipeptidyl-peptidase 4
MTQPAPLKAGPDALTTPARSVRIVMGALLLALSACASLPFSPPRSETFALQNPAVAALTAERLYASPSLSGPTARGVKFSPDGKRVTFLKAKPDDQSRLDLWQFDVATGAQSMLVDSRLLEPEDVVLSEAEKALRERKRTAGTTGILDYDWGTANTLLVPLGGDLHLVTLTDNTASTRRLTRTDAFEYDAKVSPAGKYVSFIRDGALWTIDLTNFTETRLSPAAEPDKFISYGVAEFVAQEEMNRFTGYWWSPDDKFVAFTRVDEASVDIVPRFDIAADQVTVIEQRYPRAGRPNALVKLFVRDIGAGISRELYGVGPDTYLARVNWTMQSLWFQTVNRDQTEITYHRTDGAPWRIWSPHSEKQKNWINLSSDFHEISADRLALTSEASGYRHIVLKNLNNDGPGALTPLTDGDWMVQAIQHVDTTRAQIFFTGYKSTVLEQHLYAVDVDGGEPVQITTPGQSWAVTLAADGQSFVGTSSSPTQPPQTGLYKSDGTLIAWIEQNQLDENHPYAPFLAAHTQPEFGTMTADDGQTLHYSIQKPKDFDPRKKYPVIVEVYGGPGAQTVTRDWGPIGDVFYNARGYVVFRLDNRGSAHRGKPFEDVIYRRTGGPEVRDQLQGVAWLKAQSFIDADRVAVQGWSYGGYMTLMTLLQAPPGTFAAAIAGAPVTDWSLYDTFYTERYMDTPADNADGYSASSVFPYTDNLASPLLVIHGMADDNVTFDNTTRLMADLQQKGKVFEVMTYPGQRHGIRGEALQLHLMRTRMAFLDRHMKADK